MRLFLNPTSSSNTSSTGWRLPAAFIVRHGPVAKAFGDVVTRVRDWSQHLRPRKPRLRFLVTVLALGVFFVAVQLVLSSSAGATAASRGNGTMNVPATETSADSNQQGGLVCSLQSFQKKLKEIGISISLELVLDVLILLIGAVVTYWVYKGLSVSLAVLVGVVVIFSLAGTHAVTSAQNVSSATCTSSMTAPVGVVWANQVLASGPSLDFQ